MESEAEQRSVKGNGTGEDVSRADVSGAENKIIDGRNFEISGDGSLLTNADTSAKILNAAKLLFLNTGYHKVSMRTLAKASGISTGPLYFHYKNKAEVFFALCTEALAALNERVRQASEQELPAALLLNAIFLAFESFYREEPLFNQIIRLAFNPLSGIDFTEVQRSALLDKKLQYMHVMKSVVDSGISSGELLDTDSIRLMLVLHALGEGIMMSAENGDLDYFGITVEELVNEASRITNSGIAGVQKGE